MKKSNAMTALVAVGLFAAVGCEQKKVSMEEMMAPPPRPAELDRLNVFVGNWKGESDMVVEGSDETMTCEGVSEVEWTVDNRFMVERFQYTMGDQKMEGVSYWTWDDKAGKYRTWSFESDGTAGGGTIYYDDDDNVWRMKYSGQNMFNGQKMSGDGTIEFVDADTMTWDFEGWDSMHLVKFMEFHGTSRRE